MMMGKDSNFIYKGICQNPGVASSLENAIAPPNLVSVPSTAGCMCFFQHTLSLRLVRSTQILMFFIKLWYDHHTFTPLCGLLNLWDDSHVLYPMLLCLHFAIMGNAICQGVTAHMALPLWLSLTYSYLAASLNLRTLWGTLFWFFFFPIAWTVETFCSNGRHWMAGRLSCGITRSFNTTTYCSFVVLLCQTLSESAQYSQYFVVGTA